MKKSKPNSQSAMVYKFVDVTNDEDINSLIFGLLLHYGFVLSVCSENGEGIVSLGVENSPTP